MVDVTPGNEGANKGYWRQQLRDKYGKFVKMGGSVLIELELPGVQGILRATGRFRGMETPTVARIEVLDDREVPKGIYLVETSKIQAIQADLPEDYVERKTAEARGEILPEESAQELKAAISGSEALKIRLKSVARHLKEKGRFPLPRQGSFSNIGGDTDVANGAKLDYKKVFDAEPALQEKYKTFEEMWNYVAAAGTDLTTQSPNDLNDIPEDMKVLNRAYAKHVLGLDPNGLLTVYRNAVNGKDTEQESAVGYVSLDQQMAWDYNSIRENIGANGRYEIDVKPDEVYGMIGYSRVEDEYGLTIGRGVTSQEGRVRRVGDLEPAKLAPWLEKWNSSFRRDRGESPLRGYGVAGQYDLHEVENFGDNIQEFFQKYKIQASEISDTYDRLYGEGAYAEYKASGKTVSFQDIQKMFIKLDNGNIGINVEALDLLQELKPTDEYKNDRFDNVMKMLSVFQELTGQHFMTHKTRDYASLSIQAKPETLGEAEEALRKALEGFEDYVPRSDELSPEIEEIQDETPGGVTHSFGGKDFYFSPEELEKARYYISAGYLGARDVTDEEGRAFNEEMRALTDYLRPGTVTDETLPAQREYMGDAIPVGELRHSAPPARFEEIMQNGIRPKITDKVGTEKYSRRRFGVFLANNYTSSEAGKLAEVFRVKVPENDLRVDSGYTPNGNNLYIERTIKPEELEHIGHIPADGSGSALDVKTAGLHDGRGPECTICNPELSGQPSSEPEEAATPDEQDSLYEEFFDAGNIDLQSLARSVDGVPMYDREMFTEDQLRALETYGQAGYRQINKLLRDGDALTDDQKKLIESIDEALAENGTLFSSARVYRGNLPKFNSDYAKFLQSMEDGKTYSFPGYFSTSNDARIAFSEFGPGIGSGDDDGSAAHLGPAFFWTIDIPQDGTAMAMPEGVGFGSGGESEVLLPRDSQFKILGIKKVKQIDDDAQYTGLYNYFIHAEQVLATQETPSTEEPSDKLVDSVRRYTDGSGTYSLVNEYLRNGEQSWMTPSEIEDAKQIAKDLTQLIEASPGLEEEQIVYRGGDESLAQTLAKLSIGDTIVDNAIISTSEDSRVAEGFAVDDGAVMRVYLPAGTKTFSPYEYRTGSKEGDPESELLLAPGTKFKLVEINGNEYTFDLVPPSVEEPTEPKATYDKFKSQLKGTFMSSDVLAESQSPEVRDWVKSHFTSDKTLTPEMKKIRANYIIEDDNTLRINKELRDAIETDPDIEGLDTWTTSESVTAPVRVYRGLVLSPEAHEKYQVGSTFVDKAYTSTAVNRNQILHYLAVRKNAGAVGDRVEFRINLDVGQPMGIADMGEIVLPRNTEFEVLKRTETESGMVIIQIRPLPPKTVEIDSIQEDIFEGVEFEEIDLNEPAQPEAETLGIDLTGKRWNTESRIELGNKKLAWENARNDKWDELKAANPSLTRDELKQQSENDPGVKALEREYLEHPIIATAMKLQSVRGGTMGENYGIEEWGSPIFKLGHLAGVYADRQPRDLDSEMDRQYESLIKDDALLFPDPNFRVEVGGTGATQEEVIARAKKDWKEYISKSGIQIIMSASSVQRVITAGRVKTIHETDRPARSGASDDSYKDTRRVYENVAFGYDDSSPVETRPVSGLFGNGEPYSEYLGIYGGKTPAVIQLKPAAKERSTYTLGDSLNGYMSPASAADPFEASMGEGAIKAGIYGIATGRNWYEDYKITAPEVQIHGGVYLEDIDMIIFYAPPSNSVIATLKKANIPYIVEEPTGKSGFKK